MWANRLRTILTMLGMVIGVGAVILMLAVGQGAQQQVQASIASMGSNLFIILSGSATSGGARMGGGAAPTLTIADAQAIEELSSVTAAAPSSPGTAQLVYGPNNWSTQITGTTPSLSDRARLAAICRLSLCRFRCAFGDPGRAAGTDRGGKSVWRRRPGRQDHPYQEQSVMSFSACWRQKGKVWMAAIRMTPC